MSELTFFKEEDGTYTAEYINGQWFSSYGHSEEEVTKAKAGEINIHEEWEWEQNK